MNYNSSGSLCCGGVCDKRFHLECVNVPAEAHNYLESIPGMSWKCSDCLRKCFCVDSTNLDSLLQDKFSELVANLTHTFSVLKADLLNNFEKERSVVSKESKVTQKYSDIIRDKSKPAIIIEPKGDGVNSERTKSEIAEKINPFDSGLRIAKVKSVKKGGVLVGCSTTDDNSRFKRIAEEKLSESYVIKEVKGILPRVKIVGITEKYSDDQLQDLIEYVIKVNSDIFDPNAVCKLLKFFPTKKKANIFQAVLQVDKLSYERLINCGGLFVGYDYCYAFDAVELNRCYKCNSFGHSSRYCNQPVCCPRCSEKHYVKECKAVNVKCSNCVNASKNEDLEIDCGHAAWDSHCPTYQKALQKLKHDILAL